MAIYACRAAGALGEWGKLVTWAERGLARKPDPEANAWLHLLQGTGLMYVGDPLRAERALRVFVGAEPRPSSILHRLYPDGWFNLGCLMRLLRRTGEELACFERAVAAFEAVDRTYQAQFSRLELAFGHLLAGNPAAARPLLERVARYTADGSDAGLETFALTCWAHYYRLVGELERSQQTCEQLLERTDLPVGSRAEALLVMSCNARDRGQERESAALIEQAYADALVHWSPSQLHRVETFMGQLAAKQAGR